MSAGLGDRMGIYDREYYRREGPSLLLRGQACKWLIIVNVVAFVLQLLTTPTASESIYEGSHFIGGPTSAGIFTDAFQLDANAVVRGQVWRLLTYGFLHSPRDLFHLIFNMLFLYWFGYEVENMYGTREFVLFYLAAIVFGGVCFVLGYFAGISSPTCIGASGGVMAIIVLCALHFPDRQILFWFIPIPIWLFILFALGPDAYKLLVALRSGRDAGNVAVAAHLGGAAFAVLYYSQNWRLSRLAPQVGAWRRQLTRPRLRVYTEPDQPRRPAPVASAPTRESDELMEAKLDHVLEKVARSGQDSLTESERQILLRASEIYKRRRT